MEKIAVYAGTFDPPTLGHEDMIKRAASLYDKLYVALMVNPGKKPIFSAQQRIKMLKKITEDFPNVEVESFDGLTAEFAYIKKAHTLVRGIRDEKDSAYEAHMAKRNEQLAQELFNHKLETVFLDTTLEYADTSSSYVKSLLSINEFDKAAKHLDPRIAEEIVEIYRGKSIIPANY